MWNVVQTRLGAPGSGWPRKRKINGSFSFLPTTNAYLLFTSLKVCDWSGHIFGASVIPTSLTKKNWLLLYVTLFHCSWRSAWYQIWFVADDIWGFMLEPARIYTKYIPGTAYQYGSKNRRSKHCSTQLIQRNAHLPQHKSWFASRPRQHHLSSPLFPLDAFRLIEALKEVMLSFTNHHLLPILLSRHDNAFHLYNQIMINQSTFILLI